MTMSIRVVPSTNDESRQRRYRGSRRVAAILRRNRRCVGHPSACTAVTTTPIAPTVMATSARLKAGQNRRQT